MKEKRESGSWRLMQLGASVVLVALVWGLRLWAPEVFDRCAAAVGKNGALMALGERLAEGAPLTESVREVFFEEPEEEESVPVLAEPVEAAPELGIPTAPPVEGEVTSPYGERVHPADGLSRFHYGADIGAAAGTAVTAFADGKVTAVGESVTYGTYVVLSHAAGLTTLYAHLQSAAVAEGEEVSLGDTLGTVGETEGATGPCLHFELLREGAYLDPAPWL